ncbi:hypothetical protein BRAS3843_1560027 [Bradyrhizobium sp. STM 3843]|nr:hypothetical protein BRAS3843_1560027 [Bradyrhizobium sp. STM 3843]
MIAEPEAAGKAKRAGYVRTAKLPIALEVVTPLRGGRMLAEGTTVVGIGLRDVSVRFAAEFEDDLEGAMTMYVELPGMTPQEDEYPPGEADVFSQDRGRRSLGERRSGSGKGSDSRPGSRGVAQIGRQDRPAGPNRCLIAQPRRATFSAWPIPLHSYKSQTGREYSLMSPT